MNPLMIHILTNELHHRDLKEYLGCISSIVNPREPSTFSSYHFDFFLNTVLQSGKFQHCQIVEPCCLFIFIKNKYYNSNETNFKGELKSNRTRMKHFHSHIMSCFFFKFESKHTIFNQDAYILNPTHSNMKPLIIRGSGNDTTKRGTAKYCSSMNIFSKVRFDNKQFSGIYHHH